MGAGGSVAQELASPRLYNGKPRGPSAASPAGCQYRQMLDHLRNVSGSSGGRGGVQSRELNTKYIPCTPYTTLEYQFFIVYGYLCRIIIYYVVCAYTSIHHLSIVHYLPVTPCTTTAVCTIDLLISSYIAKNKNTTDTCSVNTCVIHTHYLI